jgi:hypothetical protein
VRHARRILQERAAAGKLSESVRGLLSDLAIRHFNPTRQLRAMWALHVTGGLPDDVITQLLQDDDEYVRAWTVQLALDREKPKLTNLLPQFASMAASDKSQVVRLYLAAAMQRVPPEARWEVLEGLTQHSEDASDHNLPLMYWYAAEPLGDADPERALALGLSCGKTVPLVRDFMIRRLASTGGMVAGVPRTFRV